MINAIWEYKKLILALLASLLLVVGIGYFSADKKSVPFYDTKIDKLMFDRENKAPKYIITLPDLKKKEKNKDEINLVPKVDTPSLDSEGGIRSVEDLLSQMPNILTMKPIPATQQLSQIVLDNSLVEDVDKMKLPKINDDGQKPWEQYGNKVRVSPRFKRVSILFKGVGLNGDELNKMNEGLPSEVSFSFSPYTQKKGEKILSLRQRGHETYIDLLLPSKDVLKSDNGPMALNLIISQEEALERFKKLLDTGAPVGGIVINNGIADASTKVLLEKIIKEAGLRGLLVIDATSSPLIASLNKKGVAFRKADFVIEHVYDREIIRNLLKRAETEVMDKGQVMIVAENKPVIVLELLNWIQTFSPQLEYEQMKNTPITKPLALVPASNLVVED